MNVQHRLDDATSDKSGDAYTSVDCPACTLTHFIHRKTGKFSLDLSLGADTENFILVAQGWKKDHCFICRWELYESDDEHGTGYTNGRNWLCTECYERFIDRDFFSSSQPKIT